MPAFKTQADLVRERSADEPRVITERLQLPGVEVLHGRPREEVASILANVVLKAKKDMIEIRWVLGEFIEITYKV